ncbi:MAG: caspase family protein [Bacteroidia bacterium]|nr:caspase family protein [Bacteroidia bacterium]
MDIFTADQRSGIDKKPILDQWAVVIGISTYKDSKRPPKGKDQEAVGLSPAFNRTINPLEFAHTDARSFKEQLESGRCGSFKDIRYLVNEDATTRNILSALRTFLKQPKAEDLVIIYFSGHGVPDEARPSNNYFLTYDTEAEDIPGTALHMSEIKQCIDDTLLAERILVIIDSCYSGAVIDTSGRAAIVTQKVKSGASSGSGNNELLGKMIIESKPGITWLASSQSGQKSLEDAKWGAKGEDGKPIGGGAFTHALIEGINGAADGYLGGGNYGKKDGIVSVGELSIYVRDKVVELTNTQQEPTTISGTHDMPISYTGGLDTQLHFKLGKLLMEVGNRSRDLERYLSAYWHFRKAVQLYKGKKEESQLQKEQYLLWQARALSAAGKWEEAEQIFAKIYLDRKSADVLFLKGCMQLLQGKRDEKKLLEAAETLKQFGNQYPEHEKYAFAKVLGEVLVKKAQRGKIYAFLLGVDSYKHFGNLKGPLNDVEIMKEALSTFWEDVEIEVLLGEKANTHSLKEKLTSYARSLSIEDTFIYYHTGRAFHEPFLLDDYNSAPDAPYIPLFASKIDSHPKTGEKVFEEIVYARQFHEYIKGIPAKSKILILDHCHSPAFLELVESEGDYSVWSAAIEGQFANEKILEGKLNGVFSYSVSKTLKRFKGKEQEDSFKEAFSREVEKIVKKETSNQDPQFIWAPGSFPSESPLDNIYDLVNFTYGANTYYSFSKLQTFSSLLPDTPVLDVYKKLIQSYMDQDPLKAMRLASELEAIGLLDDELHLNLVLLNHGKFNFSKAKEHLDIYLQTNDGSHTAEQALAKLYKERHEVKKRALLVGVDCFETKEGEEAIGEDLTNTIDYPRRYSGQDEILRDVDIWKKLLEEFGFKVKVLKNKAASRNEIETEFKKLVEHAEHGPAVFFYAGYCSHEVRRKSMTRSTDKKFKFNNDHKVKGSILSYDVFLDHVQDISFLELAHMAKSANHLTTIIEAGLIKGSRRYIDPDVITGTSQSKGLMFEEDESDLEDRIIRKFQGSSLRLRNNWLKFLQIGNVSVFSGGTISKAYSANSGLWIELVGHEIQDEQEPFPENRGGGIMTAFLQKILSQEGQKGSREPLSLETLSRQVKRLKKQIPNSLDNQKYKYFSPIILGPKKAAFAGFVDLGVDEIFEIKNKSLRLAKDELSKLIAKLESNERLSVTQIDLGVVHHLLGERYQLADKHEEAKLQFEKAEIAFKKAIANEDEKANFPMGRLLVDAFKTFKYTWTQSLSFLRKANKLEPSNPSIKYYLATAMKGEIEEERETELITAFESYLKAGAPMGNRDRVVESLNELDPKRKKIALIEKGKKSLESGKHKDLKEGIKAFEEAIELGDESSFVFLGQAYEKQKDYVRAVQAYSQMKEVDRKKPEHKKRMGFAIQQLFHDKSLLLEGISYLNIHELDAEEKSIRRRLLDSYQLLTSVEGVKTYDFLAKHFENRATSYLKALGSDFPPRTMNEPSIKAFGDFLKKYQNVETLVEKRVNLILKGQTSPALPEFDTFEDPRVKPGSESSEKYRTLVLNGLIWMAEDMNYETEEGSWLVENEYGSYSRLYTWETAMKVCPQGWRLPSDEEWKSLAESFGEKMDGGWEEPYAQLIDGGLTGFNVKHAGWMEEEGIHKGIQTEEEHAKYWTSTDFKEDTSQAMAYVFKKINGKMYRGKDSKTKGFACRYVTNIAQITLR